jgi:hypothetical protein
LGYAIGILACCLGLVGVLKEQTGMFVSLYSLQ